MPIWEWCHDHIYFFAFTTGACKVHVLHSQDVDYSYFVEIPKQHLKTVKMFALQHFLYRPCNSASFSTLFLVIARLMFITYSSYSYISFKTLQSTFLKRRNFPNFLLPHITKYTDTRVGTNCSHKNHRLMGEIYTVGTTLEHETLTVIFGYNFDRQQNTFLRF